MTEEEQDVYSFMGISPLILSTEPVKDPKSIIVAVALPGQSTRMPNGASVMLPPPPKPNVMDAAQESDEADDVDEMDEAERRMETVLDLEPEVMSVYTAPVLVRSAELEPLEPIEDRAAEDSTTEDGIAEDSTIEDGGDNTRRRRRRRSSTAN
jgi:ribonuclease E